MENTSMIETDNSMSNTELLQSETSTQEQDGRENSFNVIQVHNNVAETPFRIVETTQGSFVALGNKRLTELKHISECCEMITEKKWELLFGVIALITQIEIDSNSMAE